MKKELIKTEIKVKDTLVGVMRVGNVDYISLTDLAKYQNENDPSGVIRNWMSNKNSFDFYSLWEELHNENFNSVESHRIKIEEVGYNRFTMMRKRWKEGMSF
ncbi:MAG: KilA-N domain-containing protein [Clostridia bacterium]|nr:KilA-N domain-containing protein [Clostridia bacterium]